MAESTLRELPPNLHAIIEKLSHFGGSNQSKFDLIVPIFYVLMLETGFVPKDIQSDIVSIDFHNQRVRSLTRLPPNWKNSETQSYSIEFILQPFPKRICKMFAMCVNKNINVNIIIDSKCICIYEFKVLRYVVSEEAEIIPLKFRHLKELSTDFKNRISNRAKSTILRDEEITDAILQDMPSEILFNIFTFLRVKDFLRLSCTCLRMKECAQYFEEKIWKLYFGRDYLIILNGNGESGCNWKEKYKKAFTTIRDIEERKQLRAYRRDFHFY